MESTPITKIHAERTAILDRKGHDYTAYTNGVHVDNLKIAGLPGIAVRLLDKATRAVALTLGGKEPKVVEETLRDTLIDSGNYADLGILFLDGTYDKFRPGPGSHENARGGNFDETVAPEEGRARTKEGTVENVLCFHSRNMHRAAAEGLTPLLQKEQVTYINTGDIHFDGAMTPQAILKAVRNEVLNAKHIHVVWDGNGMFIPMIIGMALAYDIPVSSGRVDFPQGRPSRIHTIINSLPPFVSTGS